MTSALRELDLQALYVRPRDNLDGELLIPALERADSYSCMTAFFTSHSLRLLAPGLAKHIVHGVNPVRLLVSPTLTESDKEMISAANEEGPEAIRHKLEDLVGARFNELLESPEVLESALAKHTLQCLGYLMGQDRLQIKVVLVHGGIFHPKVWIFADGDDLLVGSGSINHTGRALESNVEHIRVERSWLGGTEADAAQTLLEQFEAYWAGTQSHADTIEAPEAITRGLVSNYQSGAPPTDTDYSNAVTQDQDGGVAETPSAPGYFIPSYLEYQTGNFEHQGEAVKNWEENRRHGILSLATGAGKTITALIAGHRLYEELEEEPLLMVIAVPTLPLVEQWIDECAEFGLNPVNFRNAGPNQRQERLQSVLRPLNFGVRDLAVVVVTHNGLLDAEFQSLIREAGCTRLLIADEMHKLGRPKFTTHPPDMFDHYLGLSATPILQYDSETTDDLHDFFGGIVFEFGLEEAIGKCLVHYDYFLHRVTLDDDEVEEWLHLTAKLKSMGWMIGNDEGAADSRYKKLLIARRKILECAAEKLVILKQLLGGGDLNELKFTLVFSSDKNPAQHDAVMEMLDELDIRAHQITDEESPNRQLMSSLIHDFMTGELQVLAAKRVLDEGFNIPPVEVAYILASTTVERQWVQRRGRVLRLCAATNKQSAAIHDFLVLPPSDLEEPELSKIVKAELSRSIRFAELASNSHAEDGPMATLRPVIAEYLGVDFDDE